MKIGEVVRSGGVGRVVRSKSARFAEGDLVSGLVGWQDYALLSERSIARIRRGRPSSRP
ncbi:MAG: hypothetical protein U1F43_18550 [Myxococcota bacterium]